jgi:hypothetical protein
MAAWNVVEGMPVLPEIISVIPTKAGIQFSLSNPSKTGFRLPPE